MQLSRREFAAATAGGLSLFCWATESRATVGEIRHAHLELPAGPYTRAELSRIVACAAEAAGLPTPESITALGVQPEAVEFPESFVIALQFPGYALVVRASRQHTGAPELTIRGQHQSLELRYSQHDNTFPRF